MIHVSHSSGRLVSMAHYTLVRFGALPKKAPLFFFSDSFFFFFCQTYFPFHGAAQPIRLALAATGVSWENETVSQADWPAKKQSGVAPFGQMPLLTVREADGSTWTLAQSHAIVRFVLRRAGHAGANEREEATADSLVERSVDFRTQLATAAPWQDAERNAKAQVWLDAHLAGFVAQLDSFLAANKSGSHFLVGAKFTAADLVWYNSLSFLSIVYQAKIHLSDHVKAFQAAVEAIPGVAAFSRTRRRILPCGRIKKRKKRCGISGKRVLFLPRDRVQAF